MDYYGFVKYLHLTAATLSLIGFCLRGYWMLTENPRLNARISKIAPHVIDTLLLGAAIYLVVVSGLYPWVASWVGAKLLLLILYIVAGTVALKRGRTKPTRFTAFVIAVASVLTIFALAGVKPTLW